MVECELCKLMQNDENLVYKDDKVGVMFNMEPSALGEMIVVPLKHEVLFENLSDELTAHMAVIANKVSMAQVAALHCEGTNLLVQSGEQAGQRHAHTFIRVIPRFDGDGIDLSWNPKKPNEEEISVIEVKLRDACQKIFFKEEQKAPQEFKVNEEHADSKESERYKYMLEQLNRLP